MPAWPMLPSFGSLSHTKSPHLPCCIAPFKSVGSWWRSAPPASPIPSEAQKGRTVASSPLHSRLDSYLTHLRDSLRFKGQRHLHHQINNYRLRLQMLDNEQVDTTFLRAIRCCPLPPVGPYLLSMALLSAIPWRSVPPPARRKTSAKQLSLRRLVSCLQWKPSDSSTAQDQSPARQLAHSQSIKFRPRAFPNFDADLHLRPIITVFSPFSLLIDSAAYLTLRDGLAPPCSTPPVITLSINLKQLICRLSSVAARHCCPA